MQNRNVQLKGLIKPAVEALGYELVGVEYRRGRRRARLRVYIDKPDGITLDDCERASHQVSGVLDVEDPIVEQYDLEVSSPGLDRPLFEAEHFERFAGHKVRVRLSPPVGGRRKFIGVLLGIEDGQVRVEEDGVERRIPLESVSAARLVPAE
ncbi:MAG TPA: ribosome maturation factor RimP [Gammaproteobacteria bacterium]|nr:ribosome maturation factor RimP [Gammaproteobacteria bacterium]